MIFFFFVMKWKLLGQALVRWGIILHTGIVGWCIVTVQYITALLSNSSPTMVEIQPAPGFCPASAFPELTITGWSPNITLKCSALLSYKE